MRESHSFSIRARDKHRLGEIDSLRALSCALVIIAHTAGVFREVASSGAWLAAFSRGFGILGVLLFFGISGYVIPSSLRGTRGGGLSGLLYGVFSDFGQPFCFA